jgi:predicted NAD-dependent protein-ADP-ribosyltransferase YbiA (DUF1768 family)
MADALAARMQALQRRPVPTPRPTITVTTDYKPTSATASAQPPPSASKAKPAKRAKAKAKTKVLKFHSAAADGDGKHLSTLVTLDEPLIHSGEQYRSMEHAFHAAKLQSIYFPDADRGRLAELRSRLQPDGDIVDSKAAKAYGGATSFKRLKLKFDTAKWNEDRTSVMKEVAAARALVDSRFATILKDAHESQTVLQHYERGKAGEVFWGGDRNTLGRIYTELGKELSDEGQTLTDLGSAVAEGDLGDPGDPGDPGVATAQAPQEQQATGQLDPLPPPPGSWDVFRNKVKTARTTIAQERVPPTPAAVAISETTIPVVSRAQPRAPKGTVSRISPPKNDAMSFDEARRIAVGDKAIGERLPKRDVAVLRAPAYYLNNRQLFTSFITTLLAPYRAQLEEEAKNVSCDKRGESGFSLMTHQAVVRDYMNLFTPYRGLLLYHGLGAGKTCSSVAIAEGMKEQKVVTIMTPASLRVNYAEELKHCGDPLFRKNQYWEFVAASPGSQLASALASALNVDPQAVRKAGGAWLTDPTKASNIGDLTPEQINSLDSQINAMVQAKYRFINYNGINHRHYDEMSNSGKVNPFDNQVIIVDEVHNLVSRIVNKLDSPDSLAMRIYRDITSARNSRVVFLSGTPIVNYPNEIGVLFNMLRGLIRVYELPITPTGKGRLGVAEIRRMLGQIDTLDIIDYKATTRTLSIQCNPIGFASAKRRNQYAGVAAGAPHVTDSDVIRSVQRELRRNGVQADWKGDFSEYVNEYRALPDTMEAFSATFVDPVTGETRNQSMLKRRILGLTSYFRSPSEALMPRYDPEKDYHVWSIPMSDYQFSLYEIERAIERKQEGRSRAPKQGGVYKEATSTYRIFSRAFCNFVFPLKIDRPKPSDGSVASTIEEDGTPVLEDDIRAAAQVSVDGNIGTAAVAEDEEELADTNYQRRIEQALAELEENAAEYLSPEGLAMLSPKFKAVLEEIQKHPRSCQLLYSQFRTIEGIGVFRLILQANGFAEFKIGKNVMGEWVVLTPLSERKKPMFVLYTGTETADEKEIVRNAFNGVWDKTPKGVASVLRDLAPNNIYGQAIRLFMITASGAEGITTYNVRHVHLIEPYWHPVRTDQVIGRAMRICSHQALPPAERTVSVNLYLMTFTDKQRGEATKEMLQSDKSKVNPAVIVSSDEALNEISTIKSKVNSALLKAIKEAAIDCALYADALSGESLDCVAFPGATAKQLSYVPSIANEEDQAVEDSNKYDISWGAVEVTIDGVKYALRKGTQKLYDLASYMAAVEAAKQGKSRDPILVGVMRRAKSGVVTVRKPWEV